jgi:type IV secretion system protein VirD4
MVDIPSLGEMLRDPARLARFVADSQAWLADHAVLLGGVAVGALAVCGAASFGTAAIARWLRERRAEGARFGGKREARRAGLMRNTKLKYSGIPIGRIGFRRLCWVDEEPLLVTGGTRSGKGSCRNGGSWTTARPRRRRTGACCARWRAQRFHRGAGLVYLSR